MCRVYEYTTTVCVNWLNTFFSPQNAYNGRIQCYLHDYHNLSFHKRYANENQTRFFYLCNDNQASYRHFSSFYLQK